MGKILNIDDAIEEIEKQVVLIKEQAESDLQYLAQTDTMLLIPQSETRKKARVIINKAAEEISKIKGYKDLAKTIKKGLLQSFNGWLVEIYNRFAKKANKGDYIALVGALLLKDKKPKYKAIENVKLQTTALALKNDIDVAEWTISMKNTATGGGGSFTFNTNEINYENVSVEDIRQYVTSGETGYSQMFIENYQEQVKNEMHKISANGATVIVDGGSGALVDNTKWKRPQSLRNLAELEVRYQERNKNLQQLVNKGVKLILCSQHNNASERCAKWQGKLFLIDCNIGYTTQKPNLKDKPKELGRIDNKPYYSLKQAIDAGLLGYNCRHRLIEYKANMDMPKPIPAGQIVKERTLEFMQREYERNIRYCKKMQMLATKPDELKKWQQKSKKLFNEYSNYCKKNNLVRAEWRCSITKDERDYI